jgi:hypothetical protein
MKLSKNIFKVGTLILLFVITSFDALAQDNSEQPLPQFLFPSFVKGVTRMKGGTSFSSLLNYDMVDQIMVTELNGVYRYATKMEDIDTIYVEYKKFVPVGKVFYEVLVNGPVPFFLQNKSLYTPKGSNVGYGSKSQSVGPTDYKRYELTSVVYQYNSVVKIDLPPNVEVTPASIFWVRKNDKFEKFGNEKQFLKIFPDKAAVLRGYIKKERLNLKHPEDVVKLGIYCNELYKK